ncbi:hypothetical protein HDU96_008763 [Phlyctochytrium bullatum]|nr:hypothetical protein HDU96_008763 [Phlyctochytrium bullatum]
MHRRFHPHAWYIPCFSYSHLTSLPPNSQKTQQLEFRTVQPWECLPAGLHVRINMATGLKEAKLASPDPEADSNAIVVVPSPDAPEDTPTPKDAAAPRRRKLRFQYVMQDTPNNDATYAEAAVEAARSHRANAAEAEDDDPSVSRLRDMSPELRDEVLAALNIHPPQPIAAPASSSNTTTTTNAPIPDPAPPTDAHQGFFKIPYTLTGPAATVAASLADLEDVVGDITDGADFLRLKADDANRIVEMAGTHPDEEVRNNPSARTLARSRGYLPTLLTHLTDPSPRALSAHIYALSGLLRSDVHLLRDFLALPSSVSSLHAVVTSPTSPPALRAKVVRLVEDLVDPAGWRVGEGGKERRRLKGEVARWFCGYLEGVRQEGDEEGEVAERVWVWVGDKC